jgi:hypothetical protein
MVAARFRPATTKLCAEPKKPWTQSLPAYRRNRNPVPQSAGRWVSLNFGFR